MLPPRSPDYNLGGTLKGRIYVNNPHSMQELQDYIRGEIADISSHVLRHGPRNIFRSWEACLEAETIP